MTEKLNWNLSVAVDGGPQLSSADAIHADGYDKLVIKVPATGSEPVTVGPGNWTSVSLLMIKPSKADSKLTYQTGTVTAALDGTHLLVGAGAVSLLGNGPAQLKFINATAVDVSIDIIVARSAS